jgi:hypothetical protein
MFHRLALLKVWGMATDLDSDTPESTLKNKNYVKAGFSDSAQTRITALANDPQTSTSSVNC